MRLARLIREVRMTVLHYRLKRRGLVTGRPPRPTPVSRVPSPRDGVLPAGPGGGGGAGHSWWLDNDRTAGEQEAS